jgi:hypothetical protein
MSEEVVSLALYYNWVALPFFFITLIFGTITLFNLSTVQIAKDSSLPKFINDALAAPRVKTIVAK